MDENVETAAAAAGAVVAAGAAGGAAADDGYLGDARAGGGDDFDATELGDDGVVSSVSSDPDSNAVELNSLVLGSEPETDATFVSSTDCGSGSWLERTGTRTCRARQPSQSTGRG